VCVCVCVCLCVCAVSVVKWFKATDPEARDRFPALRDSLSSGSVTGST
jgi:hypothetical protein